MGFFSSKKRTHVNLVSTRMMDDDQLKYFTDYALETYREASGMSVDLDVNIAEHMTEAFYRSLPFKFRQARRKAKNKNRYLFGLPESTLVGNDYNKLIDGLLANIEAEVGEAVSSQYMLLTRSNITHEVWEYLVSKYDYSFADNTLMVPEQTERVYLDNFNITLTQQSYDTLDYLHGTDQEGYSSDWGATPNREADPTRPVIPLDVDTLDELVINYTYEVVTEVQPEPLEDGTAPEPYEEREQFYESISEDISSWIPAVPRSPETGTLLYHKLLELPQYVYVFYKSYSGILGLISYEYTDEDLAGASSTTDPIEMAGTYYPNLYLRHDHNDFYRNKDTDKYKHARRMFNHFNLDIDQITEDINDSIGGDASKIDTAWLGLVVSVNKDEADSITSQYLFDLFNGFHAQYGSRGHRVSYKDNLTTQEVGYTSLTRRRVSGVAENIYNMPLEVGTYTRYMSDEALPSGGGFIARALFAMQRYKHCFVYQETEDSYVIIEVTGLTAKVTAAYRSGDPRGHTVSVSGDDDNLIIPLDMSVIEAKLTIRETEALMNKSLQYIGVSVVVTKTRWWQRGVFKVLMFVIAVAITYASGGAGSPLIALVQAAVVTAITSIAIDLAIDLLVDLALSLGVDSEALAVLVAIATIAAMAYGGGGFDFSQITAKSLMKALNVTFDIYNKMNMQEIIQLQKELDTYMEEMTTESERIDYLQQITNTRVIPVDLAKETTPMNPYIQFGDTLDTYLTRVFTTDVSQISLDYINKYTDLKVQLPQFKELILLASGQQESMDKTLIIQ